MIYVIEEIILVWGFNPFFIESFLWFSVGNKSCPWIDDLNLSRTVHLRTVRYYLYYMGHIKTIQNGKNRDQKYSNSDFSKLDFESAGGVTGLFVRIGTFAIFGLGFVKMPVMGKGLAFSMLFIYFPQVELISWMSWIFLQGQKSNQDKAKS